jgi:hypothetical protein
LVDIEHADQTEHQPDARMGVAGPPHVLPQRVVEVAGDATRQQIQQ